MCLNLRKNISSYFFNKFDILKSNVFCYALKPNFYRMHRKSTPMFVQLLVASHHVVTLVENLKNTAHFRDSVAVKFFSNGLNIFSNINLLIKIISSVSVYNLSNLKFSFGHHHQRNYGELLICSM